MKPSRWTVPSGFDSCGHVAALLEERADRPMDRAAFDAGADQRDRELERLDALGVPLDELGVGCADAERAGHVREAGALEVLREEVAEHDVVVVDAAAAGVVAVRRLGAVGDDHVVAAAADAPRRPPPPPHEAARR